jgi:hypothetical protein
MALYKLSRHIIGYCTNIRGFASGRCGIVLDDGVVGLAGRLICWYYIGLYWDIEGIS